MCNSQVLPAGLEPSSWIKMGLVDFRTALHLKGSQTKVPQAPPLGLRRDSQKLFSQLMVQSDQNGRLMGSWSRLGMMPFRAWKSEFVVMNKCQHVTWSKCLLPHVSPFLLLFIGKGMNMAVPQTAQIWSKQVLLLNNQASMFHTKPANGNYICTFSGQLVSSLGISSNGT